MIKSYKLTGKPALFSQRLMFLFLGPHVAKIKFDNITPPSTRSPTPQVWKQLSSIGHNPKYAGSNHGCLTLNSPFESASYLTVAYTPLNKKRRSQYSPYKSGTSE